MLIINGNLNIENGADYSRCIVNRMHGVIRRCVIGYDASHPGAYPVSLEISLRLFGLPQANQLPAQWRIFEPYNIYSAIRRK